MDRTLEAATERLDHARSRLRLLSPAALIEQGYLRLDDLSNRLSAALGHSTQRRRQLLSDVAARLKQRSPEQRVQLESHRLLSLWKRLQSASPASVLNRGFAIVRNEEGKPISRKAQTQLGQRVSAQFFDGEASLRVEAKPENGG